MTVFTKFPYNFIITYNATDRLLKLNAVLDYYTVHYSLVGSDVRVQCLINSDGKNTEIKSFKWDYTTSKNKISKITEKSSTFEKVMYCLSRKYICVFFFFSDSKITSTGMNNLFISGMGPKDSKNYTCLPDTDTVSNSKSDRPYTHNVIGTYDETQK